MHSTKKSITRLCWHYSFLISNKVSRILYVILLIPLVLLIFNGIKSDGLTWLSVENHWLFLLVGVYFVCLILIGKRLFP